MPLIFAGLLIKVGPQGRHHHAAKNAQDTVFIQTGDAIEQATNSDSQALNVHVARLGRRIGGIGQQALDTAFRIAEGCI